MNRTRPVSTVIPYFNATKYLGLPITLIDGAKRDADGKAQIIGLGTLMASVCVARCLNPFELAGEELMFVRKTLGYTVDKLVYNLALNSAAGVIEWEAKRERPGPFIEKIIRQLVLNVLSSVAPGIVVGHNQIPGMRLQYNKEWAPLPMTFKLESGNDLTRIVYTLQKGSDG